MTTKGQKLTAIYEKVANKELNKWCAVSITETLWATMEYWYDETAGGEETVGYIVFWENLHYLNWTDSDFDLDYFKDLISWKESLIGTSISSVKIIGHPVLIGDVLEKGNFDFDQDEFNIDWDLNKVLVLWENKILPIEDQSELCISYIFNLIK